MTVQEAIEILRDTPIDIRSTRDDDIHTLYATAQGMAIEALQRGLENVNADSCSEKPNRSDAISRQDAKDRLTVLVNEIEGIFADIRERNVDDSVCGLCEYDCDHGIDGSAFECLGFERDDCFKLKDEYREEWTDVKALPSAQLKPKTADSGSVDSEQPEIKKDRTIGGTIYQQEAIERLHNLQSIKEDDLSAYIGVWYKGIKDDYDEALKMAIEALTHFNSDSNSIKNELNELDVISRQDAIYYVKQATIGETDVMKAWVKAQTHLMRLPSVQLEPKTSESGSVDSEMPEIKTDRTIGGMIYRQDAIDEIEMLLEQSEDDEHDRTWNNAIRGSINAIKHHVPSAQPEDVIHITGRRKFVSEFDFDEDEPERKKGEWIPCSE